MGHGHRKSSPSSCVTGMDLFPIQPSVLPSNVEFLIGDFTAPWEFDYAFDYDHSRAIAMGGHGRPQLGKASG